MGVNEVLLFEWWNYFNYCYIKMRFSKFIDKLINMKFNREEEIFVFLFLGWVGWVVKV